MRVRKTYIVLSFRTTLQAMEWEKQCLAAGVPAWRMLPEEDEQWQHRLDAAGYDRAAAVEQ